MEKMVEFGESEKMIKISGKVDKSEHSDFFFTNRVIYFWNEWLNKIKTGSNIENFKIELEEVSYNLSYLPTPALGQDMTQGQFLSGV